MDTKEKRPAYVDMYKKAALLAAKAEKLKKGLRPQVLEYLHHSDHKDIYLQLSRPIKVDSDKAVDLLTKKLADGKLTQEQFDSFFVMAFDQNVFLKSVRKGVIPKEDVTRDIAWKDKQYSIRVV